MKLITTCLTLFIIVFSVKAKAQDNGDTLRVNSLNELLNITMQHNPTLAVYQQQIAQASYNLRGSKGFYYPNASASFNGTDNLHLATTPVPGELVGQPGKTFYAKFGKPYTYNTGITLTQSIFDWSYILQSKLAKSDLALRKDQQDSYQQSLKEQVARLYFTALIASAALEISRADKLLADTLQNLSQQRLKEGTSDLLAVNQSAINYNNVQQNQYQSQQLYDQSLENLKILLGEKPANELSLTEKLNFDLILTPVNQNLGADKGLSVYEQQVSIADLQSRSQKSVAYPKISASGFLGDQQFRNNFGLSFTDGAWNNYSYIALNINLPLFTGFTNFNKYKSATVQKNITLLQLQDARRQSAINDQLLLKNYNAYLQMVKNAANSFRLYGDNLRLNQQKYQEGLLSMDIYLRAFQDYLAAENLYLNNISLLLSTKSTILSRQ